MNLSGNCLGFLCGKKCIDFCLFVKGGGNVVYVIIVSIVVIGCIIILRLYCMVCILQWNWCVSVAYACSVPSLTRSHRFVTVGLYKP